MVALITRRASLLAKIELVEGVAETLSGTTDAILFDEVNVMPQPNIIDTTEAAASLDVGDPIVGVTPFEMTCRLFLKGSGTAGTPPEAGVLLQVCGLAETIVAVTSVTYDPASTAIPTATIEVNRDGVQWTLVGCRGRDFVFTATSGGLWVGEFTIAGLFSAKADVVLPTQVLDATRPVAWKGGTMTIAAAAAALRAFTLGQNLTTSFPDNPNAVEGLDVPQITGRHIQGSMDPLETLVATRNIFADFRAGTPQALQLINGAVAGNILTLDVPLAMYRDERQGDRDGFLMVDVPFTATGVDSGFSLAFT